MDFERVLRFMGHDGWVALESDEGLASAVHQKAKEFKRDEPAYNFRKPPAPVSVSMNDILSTSPAEVLRQVGVATTFFDRSPFQDIARHWAQIRYCATLAPTKRNQLAMSNEGATSVEHHNKVAQSEHLGIGFALIVAQEVLRKRNPGWEFQAVDVDIALSAGFIDGLGTVKQSPNTRKRPDYFLIGHPIGGFGGAKVVVLECKGTHKSRQFAIGQLARACAQVSAVEVGGKLPYALMVASYLSSKGITSYVLDPPGEDELWSGSEDEMDAILSEDPGDPPELRTRSSDSDDEEEFDEPGQTLNKKHSPPEQDADDESETEDALPRVSRIFDIPQRYSTWFFKILSRTAAATTLLFAGDSSGASKFTTPQQRSTQLQLHPEMLPLEVDAKGTAGTTAMTHFDLADDLKFLGTKQEMPLPDGRTIEVHRGIDVGLYHLLSEGQLGPYLRRAHETRSRWLQRSASHMNSNDVVSVGTDGTALRMRIRE